MPITGSSVNGQDKTTLNFGNLQGNWIYFRIFAVRFHSAVSTWRSFWTHCQLVSPTMIRWSVGFGDRLWKFIAETRQVNKKVHYHQLIEDIQRIKMITSLGIYLSLWLQSPWFDSNYLLCQPRATITMTINVGKLILNPPGDELRRRRWWRRRASTVDYE